MLQRVTGPNSVVYYRSPLLAAAGVPHAFATRLGGVSAGAFASLNLGNPNGVAEQDDTANIAENYRRLHAAIGCERRERVFVHQVHGCGVETARPGEAFDVNRRADAVFTDDPSRLASVRTADCVPVLLASSDGRRVAACHAGWRGTVAGVVVRALERFEDPAGVVAAIGPGIGLDAFEVGGDVADEFDRAFGPESPTRRGADAAANGKAHVDLKAALLVQLRRAGVTRIDTTDRCTVTHVDEFFSHRRDRGVTGRMAAVIGPRDAGQQAEAFA